ncbi:MAG TPA: methyltransferase domain-containing protein [Puia sp.]
MKQTKEKADVLVKSGAPVLLEIGSGAKYGKNGWVCLDRHSCDLVWDLQNGIPFPDNSVQKIYSSHTFEHFSFQEAKVVLQECRRALAPGGLFLICVPNARLYIEAYLNNPDDNFIHSLPDYHKPGYNGTTRMDLVNYVAYMGGEHKYMFDQENLLHILTMNGFKNVRQREFDPGIDMQQRHFESLYAQGEK